MLRAYPTTVPPEALSLVLTAFQGQPVNKPEAVHAAYETVGFCLGKVYPDNTPVVVGAVVTDVMAKGEVRGEELPEIEAAFGTAIEAINSPEEVDGLKVAMLSPFVITLILRAAREILNRI